MKQVRVLYIHAHIHKHGYMCMHVCVYIFMCLCCSELQLPNESYLSTKTCSASFCTAYVSGAHAGGLVGY